jgi:translation initiation factor 1
MASSKQPNKQPNRQPSSGPGAARRVVYSTDPQDETPKVTERTPAGANPAAPIATRQQNQPVIVGIERKGRGGKTVSVITGVMSHEAGQQALLKLFKNKLGTGGTLKDGVLEIQGDHRDQIVELLNGLGYKAKKSGG